MEPIVSGIPETPIQLSPDYTASTPAPQRVFISGAHLPVRVFFSQQNRGNVSARVLCIRYSHNGQRLRLRENLYVLAERWLYLSLPERYRIANRIQVPSYVSLATALSYCELTEQLLRERVDSIARKRSIQYSVNRWQFNYHQIKAAAYNGFIQTHGFFIAEPEKPLPTQFISAHSVATPSIFRLWNENGSIIKNCAGGWFNCLITAGVGGRDMGVFKQRE